ncbi:LysE family translocator [Pseudocolwellia sp. HL-MZ19]|uniref:LysE family translocator n=1 Tax=unclassified Pseudocolwellia TaxID=2848178 RepID=UPI003CEBF420
MDLSTWLLYISVISVLLLSPGPSGLLCLSDGLTFGHKKAIPTVLGGATSALVLMTISAVGLGAVLAASTTLFLVIKLLGAVYLIYLGWMAWKEGGITLEKSTSTENKLVSYSAIKRYQKGFMIGISNPKDLLFFIALFPSFMNAELPAFEQYIILACTWFILECISMFMYVCLGSKISPFFSKQSNMNLVNRMVGSVFIFLGGALALSTIISKKI